jgi:hypothetical protein
MYTKYIPIATHQLVSNNISQEEMDDDEPFCIDDDDQSIDAQEYIILIQQREIEHLLTVLYIANVQYDQLKDKLAVLECNSTVTWNRTMSKWNIDFNTEQRLYMEIEMLYLYLQRLERENDLLSLTIAQMNKQLCTNIFQNDFFDKDKELETQRVEIQRQFRAVELAKKRRNNHVSDKDATQVILRKYKRSQSITNAREVIASSDGIAMLSPNVPLLKIEPPLDVKPKERRKSTKIIDFLRRRSLHKTFGRTEPFKQEETKQIIIPTSEIRKSKGELLASLLSKSPRKSVIKPVSNNEPKSEPVISQLQSSIETGKTRDNISQPQSSIENGKTRDKRLLSLRHKSAPMKKFL